MFHPSSELRSPAWSRPPRPLRVLDLLDQPPPYGFKVFPVRLGIETEGLGLGQQGVKAVLQRLVAAHSRRLHGCSSIAVLHPPNATRISQSIPSVRTGMGISASLLPATHSLQVGIR